MNKLLKCISLLILTIFACFCFACEEPISTETPNESTINQQNMRSVVEIYNAYLEDGLEMNSFGSGVILEENQEGDVYVATNLHVVSSCIKEDCSIEEGAEIVVSFNGGGRQNGIKAEVIGFYKNFDIAVLYVKDFADKFSIVCPIEIEELPEPIVTEKIRVIANALGKGTSVTEGIVSKDSEYISMGVSYQTLPITIRQIRVDASMNQGCSGGGVFNEDGKFLGLVNARSSKEGVDDFGYVIPSATVIPLTEKLIIAHKNNGQGKEIFSLGAFVFETNPIFSWVEDEKIIKSNYTVVVSSVSSGTIASVFLQKDDVLMNISVNGKIYSITREFHLDNVEYLIKSGDQITFKYFRAGTLIEYSFSADQAHMVKK